MRYVFFAHTKFLVYTWLLHYRIYTIAGPMEPQGAMWGTKTRKKLIQILSSYRSKIFSFIWPWITTSPNFCTFRHSCLSTGKSLSEVLLFAEHGENMLCTKIVLNVRNNLCTKHVLPRFELGIFMDWICNLMNNLSSCCWCKNKSFWQKFTCIKHLCVKKRLGRYHCQHFFQMQQ